MKLRTTAALLWMAPAFAALFGSFAQAANRAETAQKEIVIGHVAGYTGPVTKDATEIGGGAQVYFDSVNAKGGVLGRKIKFVPMDDHFKADELIKLIESSSGKVSALLPPVGSLQFDQALKAGVLDRIDFPILGVIPGVESFREPLRKNLFHYRAGDYDQIEKMIDLTTSVGMSKIGILATNNPNGDQAIAFMQDVLAKRNLKLAAVGKYTISGKIDFGPAIKEFQKLQPDMVIVLGPPFATAQFIKEAKSAAIASSLYGMSYTDFKLATKLAGNEARGVAIAQVFPNLNNRTIPLVREFRSDFEKFGKIPNAEPSYFNLEGYIGAKILVEAIRRSKDGSGQGVRRGLEMLREYDMGGFIVDFSPNKHTGSKFVDLSIIGARGELVF